MTTPAEGAAPAGAAGGEGQGAPAAAPSWYSTAPEELRGLAELKGWDVPEKALKSYRELEKFRGVPPERLLTLPDKDDSPEWEGVHGKLGRPEKPEGYEIEGADPELLAALHKEGLSKRQAKNLAGVLVSRAQAAQAAAAKQSDEAVQAEDAALRREWGAEYDANVKRGQEVAAKVFKAVGFESKEEMDGFLDAMQKSAGKDGYSKTMKLFAFFGRNLGEHGFVQGDAGAAQPFGMTPAAAKAAILALEADPAWQKRFLDDNKATRAGAMAEKDRLYRVAYPD